MRLKHFAGSLFIILLGGMLLCVILTSKTSEFFVDAGRCGVNLPSCSGKDIRCINGYCSSDIPKSLPNRSSLSITPPTAYPYR